MYNITIHCGADFHLAFTIREEDGALVDLTDATVDAQLREYPESKDKHDFDSENTLNQKTNMILKQR